MFIHYVEDNDLDARLMAAMTRTDRDITVSISHTLEELKDHIHDAKADCIVLDMMRPDSLSIEDDIRRIRELTEAPVLIVTSSDADMFRARALQAGADALIEKTMLSSDVLKQIFYNISSRAEPAKIEPLAPAPEPESIDTDLFEEPALGEALLPNSQLERLNQPLRFLQKTISELLPKQSYENRLILGDVEDLVDDLRTLAQSDMRETSRVSVLRTMKYLEHHLAVYAGCRGLKLRISVEDCHFVQMGPPELARSGINQLLTGLLSACEKGDLLLVRAEKTTHGVLMQMTMSHGLLGDTDTLFDPDIEVGNDQLGALASVQAGIVMLGVGRAQCEVVHEAGLTTLRLYL